MGLQELALPSHLKHQTGYLKYYETMVLKILGIKQRRSVNSERQGENEVGSGIAPVYCPEKVSSTERVIPGRVRST